MTDNNFYKCPFETRYAGEPMKKLFSPQRKFGTWRRIWLALARAQKELGLGITDAQVKQMSQHLDDIDFDNAARYEKKFRHDVMAHIHAFADVAPDAKGIIHLGATSQDIVDNADLVVIREAMNIIIGELAAVIDAIGTFAEKHRDLPCLAFTHFQPAQPTTVGKRAAMWCAEFIRDIDEIEMRLANLQFRGIKGATGTQASFLALFDGDAEKVRKLETLVAKEMGFDDITLITGQTYSKKVDSEIAASLAGIGATVHRFCNDVRLLANHKELEEPFSSTQVGSSAMAYKRNPMRCERATALARFLMSVSASPLQTAAEQWLERTLDDSANKRLAMSQSFLAADSILRIILNVSSGLVTYPAVIKANLAAELPFMATENILMAAVKAGGDRQELHEKIRTHSQAAGQRVKLEGKKNDLLSRLKSDPAFEKIDIDTIMNPSDFVGLAPQQVDKFIEQYVAPIREKYADKIGKNVELNV